MICMSRNHIHVISYAKTYMLRIKLDIFHYMKSSKASCLALPLVNIFSTVNLNLFN